MSQYEAFIHFLGLYASWLKGAHNMIWNTGGGFKDVDTFEELMLSFTMEIMHDKKWDKDNWVKVREGYKASPESNLMMNDKL